MGGDFRSTAVILIAFLVAGSCFPLVFRLLCDVQKLDKIDQTTAAFIISIGSHSIGSHATAELLVGASLSVPRSGHLCAAEATMIPAVLRSSVYRLAQCSPVLVAVVASLLFSAVYRRDITCPRLRRLRLARKTGTLSVRHHTVVSHDGGWLIVERDDGEQRPGRARAFSIRGESGALFPGGVTVPKPFARRSPASGGNPRTRCQYTRYEP